MIRTPQFTVSLNSAQSLHIHLRPPSSKMSALRFHRYHRLSTLFALQHYKEQCYSQNEDLEVTSQCLHHSQSQLTTCPSTRSSLDAVLVAGVFAFHGSHYGCTGSFGGSFPNPRASRTYTGFLSGHQSNTSLTPSLPTNAELCGASGCII